MDLAAVEALLPAPETAWQPGDTFLAGGTWLFSEPQPAVRRLLDLTAYRWPSLRALPGGHLEIAATCTLAELAQRPEHVLFRPCCDALLGSFKVRQSATVGGNICLALPAGPMISLAAALDGTCVLRSSGGRPGGERLDERRSRELPVTEFVLGPRQNALRPGELLRAVRLPARTLASRTAFRQISLTPLGRSASLVIGRLDADGSLTVTITAATPAPVQVRFPVLPAPEAAATAATNAVGRWHDDVHGAPRWRAAMTRRLVAEVVEELGA